MPIINLISSLSLLSDVFIFLTEICLSLHQDALITFNKMLVKMLIVMDFKNNFNILQLLQVCTYIRTSSRLFRTSRFRDKLWDN